MNRFLLSLILAGLVSQPVCARANDQPPAAAVTLADPSSIQRAVEAACQRGESKLVLPPGTYRFPTDPDGQSSLVFSGLHDFEIDATDAVLVFTNQKRVSIRFERCERVTLRGAVLINDPIPFSQGRIEAIAADRKSFDVRVAKGYPDYLEQKEYIMDVFDPVTRGWKPGTHDIFCREVERLQPGLFRVRQSLEDQAVSIGDFLGWRGPVAPDIQLSECAGMRIEDVVVRSGKGFCVAESGGAGGNYYRYKVTYGPTPSGADEPPLMAANADAFHSSDVRQGPILERCWFEGMGDDGVPIHGSYALTVKVDGTAVILAARTDAFCLPGDILQWMDASQAMVGEAKVIAVRRLPDFLNPPVAPEDLRLFQNAEKNRYFELTLNREVPALPGSLVGNPAACGGGFVVRDCTIRNHRARGMLIKAGPGLIEGCTVEGSTIAGIVISPEMSWWNEAGYAHDLVLRNNVIRHVGYWEQPSLAMAGAVSVGAYERGRFVPLPGGHRNIVLENNRFEHNDGVNLLVSSVVGLILRGNAFNRAMENPSDRGNTRGVDPNALIWLTESREILIENNRVSQPGSFLKRLVSPTATATATGWADGVIRPGP